MFQGSEMSAGFHSRNLILGICFRLIMLNVCQWYEGFLYWGDEGIGGVPPTSQKCTYPSHLNPP